MNKFEQLLDFIVNEEKEKAEELFHEIVVEKSRDIYEQLIAEETKPEEEPTAEEEPEVDEVEEDDDSMEEAYGMEEEESEFPGGDMADGIPDETEMPKPHDEFGSDEASEDEEAPATKGDVQDLEDALEDLKAEFERLMSGEESDEEGEESDEEGEEDDQEDDEEDEEDESANPFEGRQMTREYRETVGKPYGSGNGISNKTEGGDGKAGPINANPKNRPSGGNVSAHNIAQGGQGGEGIKGGEGLVGGVKGEFTKGVEKNIASSSKAGMKSGSTLDGKGKAYGSGGASTSETGAGNTKSVVDHKQG
jgi:hypothetical protein